MRKILLGFLAALCSIVINAAGATALYGTIGYGTPVWYGYCPSECYNTSYLVELNPETGAVIDYIGEVGYRVNGLAYDHTSGKLYGGTSQHDPTFVGLIEIDTTTGAGTPVGAPYWGDHPWAVTSITVNAAGQMYAWSQQYFDLVSIDKTTGVATVVGDSGLYTGDYGLDFNSAGQLYFIRWNGEFYRVDATTGSATLEDHFEEWGARGDNHHGKFDWATDLHYTISWWTNGTSRDLLRCNFVTLSCTTIGSVGNLHTIAFQNGLGTTQYALSVDKAGAGTGTVRSLPAGIDCGSDCSQDYYSGRVVTLYAIADADSTFSAWSGNEDCSDGVVTMDAAKSCTATFNLIPTHTLSLSKAGTGTGTVTSSPLGINCGSDCSESFVEGTTVLLMALPDANSLFAGYSGDADCEDNEVTMDGARSCTVTFNLKPYYTLSVNKLGSGSGTVTSSPAGINCGSDCSESYMLDTPVTLSAVADASSVFIGWSGDSDCFDGAVTMAGARSCAATFNGRIAVTSPNGGQTWPVGTEQTITWTYEGNEGTYVTIELLKGGVLEKKLSKRVSIGTGGNGSMTWKPVGKLDGSDYSIRITSNSNPLYTDTSDGYFTIAPRH